MKTLLIIESPGKKKKLEQILGSEYRVEASFGHVRDLPDKDDGIAAPHYKPTYVSDERATATIENLRRAAQTVERVYLATDPDREGEAIAWHVAEALGLKERHRITYGEITDKAVHDAVAAPRPLNMDLVRAQEARRVLDRLVGYQVSPALSQRHGKTLSAGRVQSPALRLVVERERAIAGFVPTKHFGAKLTVTVPNKWFAVWSPEIEKGEYQKDQSLAKTAAAVCKLRVTAFADGISKAAPQAPFTTSTLQQAAQAKLKIKPKKAMEIAQRLYELGAITYMRTDSPNLSDDACEQIETYARSNGLQLAESRRKFKAKGNAQEAHEAIRPSHFDEKDAGESDEEKAMYRLIWSRAVASQLAEARFATRRAELESVDLGVGPSRSGMSANVVVKPLKYVAEGRTLIDAGWKSIYEDDPDDETDTKSDDEKSTNQVPVLEIGQEVAVSSGEVVSSSTKAPARYTLSKLVKELEKNGIGRPATYAAILDNIMRRGYVEEDKKGGLVATATGMTVVDSLVNTFQFVELDYTRKLEEELDQIAGGNASYQSVVAAADSVLQHEIGRMPAAVVHECPDCSKPLRARNGTNGPFWGCSGYPDCKTTLPDDEGKPGSRAAMAARKEEARQKCPKCDGPLHRMKKTKKEDAKGKGYDFYSCTKCPTTFNTKTDGTADLNSARTKS